MQPDISSLPGRGSLVVACAECGKLFRTYPSRLKKWSFLTCSVRCRDTHTGKIARRQTIKACVICGASVAVTPATDSPNKTCSVACRSESRRRQPRRPSEPALVGPDGSFRVPLCGRDGTIRAYAIVDADDAAWACQWRWYLADGYAVRTETSADRKTRSLKMHRELLGLGFDDPQQVDHISRDKLDNRRANLRAVMWEGNAQNKPSMPGSSSRYRGVTWDKPARKWRAQINVNGRVINLGRFEDEEDAAAVARAARAHHFPFATD